MTTSVAKRQSARVVDRRGATSWLALVPAPTFALMAWITAFDPGVAVICSAGSDLQPITGMPAMYLLMSLFHLPPWFKLRMFRAHP